MMGPVLIQGAMDVELELLKARLEKPKETALGGYRFWAGTLNGLSAVLSETRIGMVNAAAATALGAAHFSPCAVINQGLAGSHTERLHVGDIVVGESCVHINDLITPQKGRGEGSDPFSWSFHDHTEDGESMCYTSDAAWIERLAAAPYAHGVKTVGRLGSGDVFSREYDRIKWLREHGGHLCEDMESFAAYRVCARFGVPCVGVRIISNNELTGEPYQRTIAERLQEFLLGALD